MFSNKKITHSIRCPWCFLKDIDATLLYDKTDGSCYCRKCCYTAKNRKTAIKELEKLSKMRYKNYY